MREPLLIMSPTASIMIVPVDSESTPAVRVPFGSDHSRSDTLPSRRGKRGNEHTTVGTVDRCTHSWRKYDSGENPYDTDHPDSPFHVSLLPSELPDGNSSGLFFTGHYTIFVSSLLLSALTSRDKSSVVFSEKR
jgi:hypothetical protein